MIGVSGADLKIGRFATWGPPPVYPTSNGGFEDAVILLDGPVLQGDVLDASKVAGGTCGDLRRGNQGGHVGDILRYVCFTSHKGKKEV